MNKDCRFCGLCQLDLMRCVDSGRGTIHLNEFLPVSLEKGYSVLEFLRHL